MTESWTHKHLYCPNCGADPLSRTANNRPVSDFTCPGCEEVYELKSKQGTFGRKLTDGAYGTMMKRLAEKDSPSLFLLSYGGKPPGVARFTVVPKHFLIPSLIEKRRPLGPNARRAGWTGCNILLEDIPQIGRIVLYDAGSFRPRTEVREMWQQTTFLRNEGQIEAQSWLIHVMRGIDSLGLRTFSLADLYQQEEWFQSLYPQNAHIRPKIRQQLQRLRDIGYLTFVGRGIYQLRNGNAAAQPT